MAEILYSKNRPQWEYPPKIYFLFLAHVWFHGYRIGDLVNFFVKESINLQDELIKADPGINLNIFSSFIFLYLLKILKGKCRCNYTLTRRGKIKLFGDTIL